MNDWQVVYTTSNKQRRQSLSVKKKEMDNAKDEIDIFFFIRLLFAEVLLTETALHTSIIRVCVWFKMCYSYI